MNRSLVEFGKRMDSAEDKEVFIGFCKGAKHVLDLGAGTGKMAREIAEKFGCEVSAVDKSYEKEAYTENNVTYYGMSIKDFLRTEQSDKKYDCIILSAILHELNGQQLEAFLYLPSIMSQNCRIIIREPFYDFFLGPVTRDNTEIEDAKKFIELVSSSVNFHRVKEYQQAAKLSETVLPYFDENSSIHSVIFWANLAFVLSYGEDSWEREKHEYRYARSLDWCKEFFNSFRSYTGFQVYPVLDKTYRQHFINAGIPGEAFDLLKYTGMHVIIDYSK